MGRSWEGSAEKGRKRPQLVKVGDELRCVSVRTSELVGKVFHPDGSVRVNIEIDAAR